MCDKQAGFRVASNNTPDDYVSYCWHTYPAVNAEGETVGTVRALFPPTMRNDVYGGKTETEIRSMAFERYNSLVRQYGAANVSTEMIPKDD
tara:strand:- start:929 stop:1201 length:273 start_codon:yes stop_codon:yes gene_type:complete